MSGAYMPRWKRLLRHTPLMKKCPGQNYHWRWSRLCYCCKWENGQGVYDLKTGEDLWADRDREWFQIIESILNFHPVSMTHALNEGIETVKRLKANNECTT